MLIVCSKRVFRLLSILFFIPAISMAQPRVAFSPKDADSLKTILKSQQDSARINTLLNLAFAYAASDPASAFQYTSQALSESRKANYAPGLGKAYSNMVTFYTKRFSFDTAQKYLDTTLALAKKHQLHDMSVTGLMNQGVLFYYTEQRDSALRYFTLAARLSEKHDVVPEKRVMLYNNIATVQMSFGKYQIALDWFLKAARAAEALGDESTLAMALGNAGTIYFQMKDFENAADYFEKSAHHAEAVHNTALLSAAVLNLGVIYKDTGKPEKALEKLNRARELKEEINDLTGLGIILVNEGEIYAAMNNDQKAEKCYRDAEKYGLLTNNQQVLLTVYANQGTLLNKAGRYKQAFDKFEKAISIASQLNLRPDLMKVYEEYAGAAENAGDYKTALRYNKLFTDIKDSIFSSENSQALAEMGAKYNSDIKEREISLLTRDKALSNVMIEKQKKEKWMLWGLASVFMCFGGLVFRSYRSKSRDNKLLTAKNQIIELQKVTVEEKNNEILASITYAKRLQEAILPPLRLVTSRLPDSFVLYKPKDIVAGDFYWMETAGDHILFAVADCTGHGVPGAMVSVVCSNALNRTVNEMKITEPGKILDKVRELVVETFEKSESEVKDGMDISLCSYNPKSGELLWAGANNPLWIIPAGSGLLKEIKADKQPIGVVETPLPFTTHSVSLEKGDMLYIFTDGYADQFGGERGKKFKSAPFRNLLLSIASRPTAEQKKTIEESFETWKGDLEQVDDVCVMALRA